MKSIKYNRLDIESAPPFFSTKIKKEHNRSSTKVKPPHFAIKSMLTRYYQSLSLILVASMSMSSASTQEDSGHKEDVAKIESGKDRITLITLEAKDRPASEVVNKIAQQMGYTSVCTQPLKGKTISCSYQSKPAWECMIDIFERHDVTFAISCPSDIWPDERHLHLVNKSHVSRGMDGDNIQISHATQGPVIVKFIQLQQNSLLIERDWGSFPSVPFPVKFDMIAEPRLANIWCCESYKFDQMKTQDGKDNLILQPSGRLKYNTHELGWPKLSENGKPRKLDKGDRWPGVDSFVIEGIFRFGELKNAAIINDLKVCEANTVLKAPSGKEIATFISLGKTEFYPYQAKLFMDLDVGNGSFGGFMDYSGRAKIGVNYWLTDENDEFVAIRRNRYQGVGNKTHCQINIDPSWKSNRKDVKTLKLHAVPLEDKSVKLRFIIKSKK